MKTKQNKSTYLNFNDGYKLGHLKKIKDMIQYQASSIWRNQWNIKHFTFNIENGIVETKPEVPEIYKHIWEKNNEEELRDSIIALKWSKEQIEYYELKYKLHSIIIQSFKKGQK